MYIYIYFFFLFPFYHTRLPDFHQLRLLGRVGHRVGMSVYMYICLYVPFPCNLFWGLNLFVGDAAGLFNGYRRVCVSHMRDFFYSFVQWVSSKRFDPEFVVKLTDGTMYELANNVCVKRILSQVKSLQNFTLFCQESEQCLIWVFWAFFAVLLRIRFVVIYSLFGYNYFGSNLVV